MQQDSDHGLLLRSLQTLMKQASPITQTSLQEKGKHKLTPFYKLPQASVSFVERISFDFLPTLADVASAQQT